MAPSRRRGPGRPADAEGRKVYDALLAAARKLFSRHGFDAVSIRRLAAEAEANPAMIHYYFGGKRALYEAMLAGAVEPLFDRLRTVAEEPGEGDTLERLVSAYVHHLARHPWLPALVIRDVLAPEGRFRELFLREYAEPGGRGILGGVIQREIRAGRLRGDLDPSLAALSVVSLAVFPFLALPLSSRIFGVETREAFVDALVEHTVRLLREGMSESPVGEAP